MVNQAPCVNTGTNLAPTKPSTTQIPTCIFGTPKGETGRRGIPIQGIVLHCIDESLAAYDARMVAGISPADDTPHGSLHYMVSSAGVVHQYVDDANLSWGFDAYNDPLYPTNAEVTGIAWPILQGVNGTNTSPDYYVINIGLESGLPTMKNGCVNCPGPTVLADAGCDALIQLLAYLAATYEIPISSDYIQFHQFVDCNAVNECPCADFTTLLQNVVAYCEPCASPVATTLPNYDPATDNVQGLIAKTTQNCCDDAGCQICLPMDALACVIGNLIPDGDIDFFVGVMQQEDQTYCLVRNVINVDTPITGDGTVDSPLTIDRCAIEAFLPAGTILNVNGTDAQGCWIDEDAQTFVQRLETPITPVDTTCISLTVSGQSDHTLQADLTVSAEPGNFLTCEPDGALVLFDNCDLGQLIPQAGTGEGGDQEIEQIAGIDDQGCLVQMDDNNFVAYNICQFPNATGIPERLLGDNTDECPVYFTPAQVVAQGLDVADTDSINMTETPGAPVVISADVVLAGPQNGVPNCTQIIQGEGVYTPCVTFNDQDSGCITLAIVDNVIEADLDIAPPQGPIGNALVCLPNGDGAYVPTGANVVVNTPIVGSGTEDDPLDIDYTLLDAQDLCDFGGVIPVGVLDMFVGIDTNDCLRVQNPNTAVFGTIQVTDGNCIDLTFTAGDPNTLTAELITAGAQGGIPNTLSCITGQGAYVPQGAGLTFNDTSCIALDLTAGVVTASPVIAGAQNGVTNQLSCINGQGLYVPQGAGLVGLDTECIDVTITNGVISAIPIVSPTQNGVANVLSCTGQGLYVPQGANLAVDDGNCINLTFNDGTISAELIVAPAQGGLNNQLVCVAGQGAYVPLGAGLVFNDTQCIELEQTGNVITATPIISPAIGGIPNNLTCTPTGLYVPRGAGLDVLDTDCIDLTIANGIISAVPIIAPTQGGVANLLSCIAGQGLYVPQGAGLTAADSDCIDITITNGVISAVPIISPAIGGVINALSCEGTGLYVPQGAGLTSVDINVCTESSASIESDITDGVLTLSLSAGDITNGVALPASNADTPCNGAASNPVSVFGNKVFDGDGCAVLTFCNIYAPSPLSVTKVGNDIVIGIRPISNVQARQTASLVIPSSASTVVPFNSELQDALGEFNPANGVFTASCDGCYSIGITGTLDAFVPAIPPSNGQIEFVWTAFVNGAIYDRISATQIAVDGNEVLASVSGSATVCMSDGDTLDFRIFQDSGANRTLGIAAGTTRVSISRLLSA